MGRNQCGDCPYRESSEGFVPGTGPIGSTTLICGEAPGRREVDSGTPFIGQAGQELNKLLSIAGINRSEVYITNAVKCLPQHKTPSDHQVRECQARHLNDEIDSHRFKHVLALGRIATIVFGVPQARKQGPAHGYILNRGTYDLMSTWHPAYLLRTQYLESGTKGVSARVEAQHDMMKFKRYCDGDLPIETPPSHLVDINEVFSDNPDTIAVDIETTGLDKFNNDVKLFGIAWKSPSGTYKMASSHYDRSTCLQILSSSKWNKVFHNVNFDVGVMKHKCGIFTVAPFACTQMTGALLASDLPKGLEFLARAYLNTPPWKWTSDTDHQRYNGIDCWATLRLHEQFTKPGGELAQVNMEATYERSLQALEQTVYAHMRGVRVDVERMRALNFIMSKKIVEAEERLNAMAREEGCSFINWNSPQQVAELLYDKLGLPKQYTMDVKKKTRRVTCDSNALEALSSLHPIPQAMRGFKLFSKYVSTYLNYNLVQHDRLYPEFLMDVTTTGRFSSRGPNFQNQPRSGPIKSIYLPDRNDHYFVEVDFSQIEMRVMVHLSGEPALVQAYEEGLDLHTTVACQVFEKDTVTKEERHMAKYIVYGLGYGRGAASVAQQYGWPISQAQDFVRAFAARFPTLWEWRREQVRLAERQGFLGNPFNRRRYFYGRNFETRAYNFIPQSTALDILIDGMKALADKAPTWRQMIWVHDSYCLSIPKKEIEDARRELPKILGTCKLGWPTPIDIEWGNTWGDAKAGKHE